MLLDNQGWKHPVGFASRQTNPAETKYALAQLEVAALVYTVDLKITYLAMSLWCTQTTEH